MISASSDDLDRAIKEVLEARLKILREARAVLIDQINHAVFLLTTYPPETSGNRPPPPYWQRDYGLVGAGGVLLQPSEHYTRSWVVDDSIGADSISILAQNDVSYAPWVVGTRQQSRIHEENGWLKVREALNEAGLEGADEFVNGEITPPSVLIDRLSAIENAISSITG